MIRLKTSIAMAALIFATNALAAGGGEIVASDPTKHFDPKGKLPSTFTVEAQKQQRAMWNQVAQIRRMDPQGILPHILIVQSKILILLLIVNIWSVRTMVVVVLMLLRPELQGMVIATLIPRVIRKIFQ